MHKCTEMSCLLLQNLGVFSTVKFKGRDVGVLCDISDPKTPLVQERGKPQAWRRLHIFYLKKSGEFECSLCQSVYI